MLHADRAGDGESALPLAHHLPSGKILLQELVLGVLQDGIGLNSFCYEVHGSSGPICHRDWNYSVTDSTS